MVEVIAELEQATAQADVAGVARAIEGLRRAIPRAPSADRSALAAAIEPLMSAVVAHPHAATRAAAAAALGQLGDVKAAPALRRGAADADVFVRVASIEALAALGRPACVEAMQELRRGLVDPSHLVNEAAVAALRVVGPSGADPALPELVDALRRQRLDEPALRFLVAVARERPGPALPGLVECLERDPPHVRLIAAKVVGFLGPAAHEAAPTLGQVLLEPNLDADLARAVVAALGALGAGSAPAGDALLSVAQRTSAFEDVRVSSLRVLARLPSSATRLAALERLASGDPSTTVREAAREAVAALRAGSER